MAAKRNGIPLSAKEGKVLAAVKEVAEEGYDPSPDAVALLLLGDERVERFHYLRTYGSLISLTPKKIKTLVSALLKKGCLNAYSPPPGEGR
ncbi:MAG: hypothetical protein K6E59_05380, partial [Bacilli bacterium]|nr:hypothetical protein [Bacilli bacterium]